MLQSLAEPEAHRAALTILTVGLMGIALVRSVASPILRIVEIGADHDAAVSAELEAADAGRLKCLKHHEVTWILTFNILADLTVAIPVFLAMTTPALPS